MPESLVDAATPPPLPPRLALLHRWPAPSHGDPSRCPPLPAALTSCCGRCTRAAGPGRASRTSAQIISMIGSGVSTHLPCRGQPAPPLLGAPMMMAAPCAASSHLCARTRSRPYAPECCCAPARRRDYNPHHLAAAAAAAPHSLSSHAGTGKGGPICVWQDAAAAQPACQ